MTLTTMGAMLALGACATVTRGTTNQIQIESEPSGASASTSLNHQCTTPCTITVNRKDEFSVVFKLEGHKEQTIAVRTILAVDGIAGLAGNVVVGGVVGMGVDAATGATYQHTPNPVRAVMEKAGPPPKVSPKASPKGKQAPAARNVPAPKAAPEPAAETEG